jgi:hypothetical protein
MMPIPPKALLKMKKLLQVPAVQLVNKPGISCHLTRNGEKILVVSADRWLSSLPRDLSSDALAIEDYRNHDSRFNIWKPYHKRF